VRTGKTQNAGMDGDTARLQTLAVLAAFEKTREKCRTTWRTLAALPIWARSEKGHNGLSVVSGEWIVGTGKRAAGARLRGADQPQSETGCATDYAQTAPVAILSGSEGLRHRGAPSAPAVPALRHISRMLANRLGLSV
jgi:hypothetical protein